MIDIEKFTLPVEHVSDTAWLVAEWRAMESERPDAIFSDPYAKKLVGAKGKEILARLPQAIRSEWMLSARTFLIDEMLESLISDGADTVVNLAAGLDTRPYRLALPSELRWVEVDFPPVIQYKNETLAADTPACRLTRLSADLSDAAQRAALWKEALAGAEEAVVITEGLLNYLTQENVAELGRELHALDNVSHWMMDYVTESFLKAWFELLGNPTDSGKTRFHFMPPGGLAFFKQLGWLPGSFRSFEEACRELKRLPPAGFGNGSLAPIADSGIYTFKKT